MLAKFIVVRKGSACLYNVVKSFTPVFSVSLSLKFAFFLLMELEFCIHRQSISKDICPLAQLDTVTF